MAFEKVSSGILEMHAVNLQMVVSGASTDQDKDKLDSKQAQGGKRINPLPPKKQMLIHLEKLGVIG